MFDLCFCAGPVLTGTTLIMSEKNKWYLLRTILRIIAAEKRPRGPYKTVRKVGLGIFWSVIERRPGSKGSTEGFMLQELHYDHDWLASRT